MHRTLALRPEGSPSGSYLFVVSEVDADLIDVLLSLSKNEPFWKYIDGKMTIYT